MQYEMGRRLGQLYANHGVVATMHMRQTKKPTSKAAPAPVSSSSSSKVKNARAPLPSRSKSAAAAARQNRRVNKRPRQEEEGEEGEEGLDSILLDSVTARVEARLAAKFEAEKATLIASLREQEVMLTEQKKRRQVFIYLFFA